MAKRDSAALRRRLKELTEAKKRDWDPVAELQPHQRKIFLDPAPSRAVIGTRQFGKSTLATVEIIHACMTRPGSESAYVDMDQNHGERVMFREIGRLLSECRIPAKVIDNELHFENGSVAYIFSGAPAEIKKLQGMKFAILILDEAQECAVIEDILTMCSPALMRFGGRVMLTGIPGRVAEVGPWWDLTEGSKKHLFSQHRGTFRDNKALDPEAAERLYEAEKERLGETNLEFLRHWKGEWPTVDNALRVYHYDPGTNGYDGHPGEFELYSLGLDPGGVRDSEAVVVVGHGRTGPVYAVDEEISAKKEGGGWDDTADRVGPFIDKYNPAHRFYDYGSANKSALTLIYMQDRQILMDAVPDKDPYNESKRINVLFAKGLLFIKRGSKLERDMLYTTWDPETLGSGKKPKYSPSWKQDGADALRAAMWGVYAYQPDPKQAKMPMSDVEAEAKRVADGEAYKRAKQANRSDKYSLPGAKSLDPSSQSRVTDRFGRVRRGY
jgi:hypothetical protein